MPTPATSPRTREPSAALTSGGYVNCAAGDLGPNEAVVIPAGQSATGEHLLVVGYTTSGSTRIFRIVTAGDSE
jgi:hypothetical protein